MSKCLIFFGQNRLSEVFVYYLNKQLNLEEYDIYISGWLYDKSKLDLFKKYFTITNFNFIDPVEYLEQTIDSFNVKNKAEIFKLCTSENLCRAYAQHISVDNIKNFVDLKKYQSIYITRSDTVNLFVLPKINHNNTIYDKIVKEKINGNFLYGDGQGCYNFCFNFLKNTIQYYDDLNNTKTGSPRFLWYNNSIKSGVNITSLKLTSLFIRPGVENYNWKSPQIIDKWGLYVKLKNNTNCVNNIKFNEISTDTLISYKRKYLDIC